MADVHFDFFHVEPSHGQTFTDALNAISGVASDRRHAVVYDRLYRISYLSRDSKHRLWTGDIVRVQMEDLPGIGSITSDDIKDIPLEPKEDSDDSDEES